MAASKKGKRRPPPRPRKRHNPIPPEDRPLTELQNRFVAWYVSAECDLNATKAAEKAGYKGGIGTLRAIGCKNLKLPNVRKAVDKKLAEMYRGSEVTIETTLRRLERLSDKAEKAGQFSAAVRSVELQGKYLKMFTDRIEHTESLDSIEWGDLVGLLTQVLGEIGVTKTLEDAGIDLAQLLDGAGAGKGAVSDSVGDTTTH